VLCAVGGKGQSAIEKQRRPVEDTHRDIRVSASRRQHSTLLDHYCSFFALPFKYRQVELLADRFGQALKAKYSSPEEMF